ncbi:MAG: hypothetical protein L0Z53_11075 [Acidobacteriales bacterium]|nr:hypothetical protein [Terriglobales bacterium]
MAKQTLERIKWTLEALMGLEWLWGKIGISSLSTVMTLVLAALLNAKAYLSGWSLAAIASVIWLVLFGTISIGIPRIKRKLISRPLSQKEALEVTLKSGAETTLYVVTSGAHGGLVQADDRSCDWCSVLGFSAQFPAIELKGVFASLRYFDLHGKELLGIRRGLWIEEAFNSIKLTRNGQKFVALAIQRQGTWYAIEDRRFTVAKRRDPELIPLPANRTNVEVKIATTYGDKTFSFALEVGLGSLTVHLLGGKD